MPSRLLVRVLVLVAAFASMAGAEKLLEEFGWRVEAIRGAATSGARSPAK